MSKYEKAHKEPKHKLTKAQKENFKRKFAGLGIGLIGVFLLLFVIFYTVSRVFRPADLAVMLPIDKTIALVQINVNPKHEQVRRLYDTLNSHTVYHPISVQNMINEMLDVNFEKDIQPWLNRQVGFALIEKEKTDGEFDLAVFIETKDIGKTKNFMESRGLKSQEDYLIADKYNGVEIYRYALGQTFNFIFLNNYLIVGNNDGVLKQIIDSEKSSALNLMHKADYSKVSQNLPITTLAFSYLDTPKLLEFLKSNDEFMSEKGHDLLAFEPFLKIYKGMGMTLVMENEHMVAQTYTMLDGEYLEGRDLLSFDNKFRANFLELVPGDLKFYAGGLNLKKQLFRYSEIFNVGGDVSYLIYEGALRSLKNEYFGEAVDLEEDLYPLLQGEYLFAVNGDGEGQATTLILELEDPLRDKENIEQIAESFIKKSAVISPKEVEVELEDGSTAKEIVSEPAKISKSSEEYKGYVINVMNIEGQNWGVYYLIVDDRLVISTKLVETEKTIDLFINSGESFKASELARDNVQPVLRTTDEVMFLDLSFILDGRIEAENDWIKPYFEPFKYLSIGKNYFKDGISTINYITIE